MASLLTRRQMTTSQREYHDRERRRLEEYDRELNRERLEVLALDRALADGFVSVSEWRARLWPYLP